MRRNWWRRSGGWLAAGEPLLRAAPLCPSLKHPRPIFPHGYHLPTTVIIDRAGREVARLEGEAAWDAPELVAAVRRLVGAP